MIALIRQIILCVTAASLFGAVSLSLVPDGALKEVTRLGVGLVLVLSLALPLRQVIALPSFDWGQQQPQQEDTTELYREAVRQQMETETAEYMMKQIDNMGIDCTAQATAAIAEDGTVSIAAVCIAPGKGVTEEQLQTLKQWICAQLGVADSAVIIDREGAS